MVSTIPTCMLSSVSRLAVFNWSTVRPLALANECNVSPATTVCFTTMPSCLAVEADEVVLGVVAVVDSSAAFSTVSSAGISSPFCAKSSSSATSSVSIGTFTRSVVTILSDLPRLSFDERNPLALLMLDEVTPYMPAILARVSPRRTLCHLVTVRVSYLKSTPSTPESSVLRATPGSTVARGNVTPLV